MSTSSSVRISSLDVLRGLVIVLMALDHVRDFFAPTLFAPEDVAQTSPAWFFTRWITHFCAPVFVFLAGTSAYLYGQKMADKRALSRFLLTRGAWLVALEVTVINLSWMFDWPWNEGFMFVQVIWAIGVSMLVLAGLAHLPLHWIAGFGFMLVLGHNALDGISPDAFGPLGWLWKILHVGFGWIPYNADQSFGLLVIYPLIPWMGVMALGYVFGQVMQWEQARRLTWLFRMGLGGILFFIALRTMNWYGDPRPWGPQERGAVYSLLSFLNASKYPPSLLFLCMTLGPGLLLLALFERLSGPAVAFLQVFGRVPFFFYLLHFSMINAGSRLYFYFTRGWHVDFFSNPPDKWPPGYTASLGLAYAAWAVLITILYFLCRWYGRYKFTHNYWWLKYI